MKNFRKILVIILIMTLAFTTMMLAGCSNSLEDKLDDILKELSQIRKEMTLQQEKIDKLIGAENINVILNNPTQQLVNHSKSPYQELESGYKIFELKYEDIVNHKGETTIYQKDVLEYLKDRGDITYELGEYGVNYIKTVDGSYSLDSKDSTSYIFNFTTVAKMCPPAPSAYDYSFKNKDINVFSSYQPVPKTLVTKGSIMGFGFVAA